jgi:hypothetical protein
LIGLDDVRRPSGVTRRSLVRGAAAAAAAGLAGSALSACGLAGAKTSLQQPKIVLTFQPNGPTTSTAVEIYQKALEPWYKQNKGVEVKPIPVQMRSNPNEILAGTASDIIWDNYPPGYISPTGNLLLPLDNLIKRDGIDVTKWSSSQINSYRTAAPDHGLYMLPNYFSPLAYVVRLSDFDEKGVERPNPNWTAAEFATAAQQMTKNFSNGQKRYGAVVQWYQTWLCDATWPFYAYKGGNGIVNSEGLADLTAESAIQVGNYLYEQLFWPGYCTTRDALDPMAHPTAQIKDEVTTQLVWGFQPLYHAQYYQGFVWDYYLPPTFPNGPTCMGTDDFFAIPATTKHPEQAWSLLQYISYDPSPTGWQQQNMRISLLEPCLNALWDVWASTLRSVAPPLVNKNLEIFKTMALNGRAFPEDYFPIGDPQIQTVPDAEITALWKHEASVPLAFAQIQHQMNATLRPLIAAAPLEEQIAAVVPGPKTDYPAPTVQGTGVPALAASQYGVNESGTWTVLGAGADISDSADDLIFACGQDDASEATWTCTLSGIANVSEASSGQPALSNWTRAGLMARANLSDNAPFAALFVTGYYGFEFAVRPSAGANLVDTSYLFWKLTGSSYQALLSPLGTPTPNFVPRPIWLQLQRQGTTWTPLASLDGKTFKQLAPSQSANGLGGAWVGLAASAHNKDFNDKGYFRATFQNLQGISPTKVVAIGTAGMPPGGGAVPSTWATQPSLGVGATSATAAG